MKHKLTLAIDTSHSAGSLSLWNSKDEQIFANVASQDAPISQNLITLISNNLQLYNFDLCDIKKILYVNGPGSYTGLRVGIATVLGLSNAIQCDLGAISIFEAFSVEASTSQDFICAILSGHNEIIFQTFKRDGGRLTYSQIQVLSKKEFNIYLNRLNQIDLVISPRFTSLSNLEKLNSPFYKEATIASDNVSVLMYKFSQSDANYNKERPLVNYGKKFNQKT